MSEKEKIRSFTDLNAWKEAHNLVLAIYTVTKNFPKDDMKKNLFSKLAEQTISTHKLIHGLKRVSDASYTKYKIQNTKYKTGFTILELLAVVAVSMAIMAIILANQGRFRRTLDLTNTAYEVALAVREAQVYGTSVRGLGGNFEAGYGVHFDKLSLDSFVLFRDVGGSGGAGNGVYNVLEGDAVLNKFTLRGGIRISELCAFPVPPPAKKHCMNNASPPPATITLLDLSFQRPDPAAKIKDNCAHSSCGNEPYGSATITLMSSDGDTRIIEILANGQIAVK